MIVGGRGRVQRSCAGPRCSACAARAFQREGVMTYIETWEEFAKSAEKLYLGNPWKVRFVVKYRHCDASLVLKITNDSECLKYRTDQLQDVKKLEKLNGILMRHMVSKEKM